MQAAKSRYQNYTDRMFNGKINFLTRVRLFLAFVLLLTVVGVVLFFSLAVFLVFAVLAFFLAISLLLWSWICRLFWPNAPQNTMYRPRIYIWQVDEEDEPEDRG